MRFVTSFLCAAAIWAVNLPAAQAGVIEQACRKTERAYNKAGLCSCIQAVADQRLTPAEMVKVSKWFADPHQAQVVRQSDRRSDERLWERYKAFGETAARACG